MLPTLKQTNELYKAITTKTDIINVKKGFAKGLSAKHYQNVAYIASVIAEKSGLNVQKAYILGLLHDYGEYIESTTPNTFHGTSGYDEMILLGFDEVARTCLTHSFFDDNFNPEDTSYCATEVLRAEKLIKKIEIDDYDKLIQLADLMSSGEEITTVNTRIERLAQKYNIRYDLITEKLSAANRLKEFFDKKCGRDIYRYIFL